MLKGVLSCLVGFVCSSVVVAVADDNVFDTASAALPIEDEQPSEESVGVEFRKIGVVQEIEAPDSSQLRAKLADAQLRYAQLFSGVELAELISKTESDIKARELELLQRKESFDERMASIQEQLESLRSSASSVGVREQLESMIEGAKKAQDGSGKPESLFSDRDKGPSDGFRSSTVNTFGPLDDDFMSPPKRRLPVDSF